MVLKKIKQLKFILNYLKNFLFKKTSPYVISSPSVIMSVTLGAEVQMF